MVGEIKRIPLKSELDSAYRQWLIDLLARGDVTALGLAKLSGMKYSSRLTHILTTKQRPTDEIMVNTMLAAEQNYFVDLLPFMDLSISSVTSGDDDDDNDY